MGVEQRRVVDDFWDVIFASGIVIRAEQCKSMQGIRRRHISRRGILAGQPGEESRKVCFSISDQGEVEVSEAEGPPEPFVGRL